MKKLITLLLIFLLFTVSACTKNEPLPELDVSVTVICVSAPDYLRNDDNKNADDTDEYSQLTNLLPEFDLDEIVLLPVYEDNSIYERSGTLEEYSLEAKQIGKYFSTEFSFNETAMKIDNQYMFGSDNGELFYNVGNRTKLQLRREKLSYEIPREILNALETYEGGDKVPSEIRNVLIKWFDELHSSFTFLLPVKYNNLEIKQYYPTNYSATINRSVISICYYDNDFSAEQSKLLRYNGFYNCCGIMITNDRLVFFNEPNLNKLIGEYRLITTAEAAERRICRITRSSQLCIFAPKTATKLCCALFTLNIPNSGILRWA